MTITDCHTKHSPEVTIASDTAYPANNPVHSTPHSLLDTDRKWAWLVNAVVYPEARGCCPSLQVRRSQILFMQVGGLKSLADGPCCDPISRA